MCKLFDTIVLPVLCYGAEVRGMVKSEEIEKIQFQFCKCILQVPIRAPTAAVMAELPDCFKWREFMPVLFSLNALFGLFDASA